MSQIIKPTLSNSIRSKDLKFISYENMPAPIARVLQNSFWITLATNIVLVALYILVPPSRVQPLRHADFFILPFTLDWFNGILWFYQSFAFPLLVLNLASLGICLLTLGLSRIFTRPIAEMFHWMIGLNAVPAGMGLITAAMGAAIVTVIVVINIITWIVAFIVSAIVIFGFIAGIGSGS
jgi:hypothetical protein